MVCCNLKGGLGNMLFQIASAYAISVENNDTLIIDEKKSHKVHNNIDFYKKNIFRKLTYEKCYNENTYNEKYFHYNKINYQKNILIDGYFQSEKYFSNHKKDILNLFSIDENSNLYINNKYGSILNDETCSIHIRRGDYLNLPNYHPICEKEYYIKAIDKFKSNTKFLIFSDDINWCKNNLIGNNFIFIENEFDYIDIWLMSLCKNNIIANSTFSWWGAWLNKNENKKIISPKKWFGPLINHNTKDLIPNTWITI